MWDPSTQTLKVSWAQTAAQASESVLVQSSSFHAQSCGRRIRVDEERLPGAWAGGIGSVTRLVLDGTNLNYPTKSATKPRTGREVPISAKGRRVGAAQVPAHTHRV